MRYEIANIEISKEGRIINRPEIVRQCKSIMSIQPEVEISGS